MLLALDMVLHLNPLMRFQSLPTRSPNPPMKHPNLLTQLPSHHSNGDVGDIGEVSYNIPHHYHHSPQ